MYKEADIMHIFLQPAACCCTGFMIFSTRLSKGFEMSQAKANLHLQELAYLYKRSPIQILNSIKKDKSKGESVEAHLSFL